MTSHYDRNIQPMSAEQVRVLPDRQLIDAYRHACLSLNRIADRGAGQPPAMTRLRAEIIGRGLPIS